MNKEEREAIEYFQDKEISFEVEIDKAEFLKALGIEETEENSFENNQIRIKTLLNLIYKQQKELENSISKQKIREKIENGKKNLENLCNSANYGDRYVDDRMEEIKNEIDILEELLEEDKYEKFLKNRNNVKESD